MKNIERKTGVALVVSVVVAVVVVLILTTNTAPISFGSVGVSDEYVATTTSATFLTTPAVNLLDSAPGVLGSVIVTTAGSAGGYIDFIDATTTSVLQRATSMATTTIYITSIPSNLAAGTYTFDIKFKYGLIMITSGTIGTTTVTYRTN